MKQLIKKMTLAEVDEYISNHQEYTLPTFKQAKSITTDYQEFWVSDTVGDRQGIFNRGRLQSAHPLFKVNVVLVHI